MTGIILKNNGIYPKMNYLFYKVWYVEVIIYVYTTNFWKIKIVSIQQHYPTTYAIWYYNIIQRPASGLSAFRNDIFILLWTDNINLKVIPADLLSIKGFLKSYLIRFVSNKCLHILDVVGLTSYLFWWLEFL